MRIPLPPHSTAGEVHSRANYSVTAPQYVTPNIVAYGTVTLIEDDKELELLFYVRNAHVDGSTF